MRILILFLLFLTLPAFAGVEQITEKEFRALAQELAPKVNLFAEAWRNDPTAEFYGGTTRDYLYWLKGQFREAHSHGEAESVIQKLKNLPGIDVREFIIGDSDVDIISQGNLALSPEHFGVKKIDYQSHDILDPHTELGKNEILQGYIPAEKIRLGQAGMQGALGDGPAEIYHGKLSIHFASAEDFAQSKFAKDGVNHPILLALRYLRLQAIDYFRSHGSGYPNLQILLHEGMDDASAAAVRHVIQGALNPEELKPYLSKPLFKKWINAGLQKAFRSYSNPTAALELMKAFQADQLPQIYPGEIETLNQYVFVKHRDPEAISEAFKKFQVNEREFYTPPQTYFTDGKLYHGTKTEAGFRGIIFQGVLPSETGSGGAGLYGVAAKDKEFSEAWANDKDRLLSFEVSPKAHIVDVTKGEGQKIWNASTSVHQGSFEKFAELFGVDMIRYPYDVQAFVVENAAVLGQAKGVYRSVKGLAELLEEVKNITEAKKILQWLSVNQLSRGEATMVWKASKVPVKDVAHFLLTGDIRVTQVHNEVQELITSGHWLRQPEVQEVIKAWVKEGNQTKIDFAVHGITQNPELIADTMPLLESMLRKEGFGTLWDFEVFNLLAKRAIESPAVKKYAIRKISMGAVQEGAFMNKPAAAYLAVVPWNEAEGKELLGIFEKSVAASGRPLTDLGELLVKKGVGAKEVHEAFLRQAEKPVAGKYLFRERWHDLLSLKKSFPEDARVKDLIAVFFAESIERLGNRKGSEGIFFKDVLPTIGEDPRIKRALFERMESTDFNLRADAIEGLSKLSLSEAELIYLIDRSGLLDTGWQALENVVGEQSSPLNPEIKRALLRSYVRTGSVNENRLRKFIALLRADENESVLREQIEQMIDRVMQGNYFSNYADIGDFENKNANTKALLDLVSFVPVKHTPELESKAFDLLERNYDAQMARSSQVRSFFTNFVTYADDASSRRAENLVLKHNPLDTIQLMAMMAPRFKNPTPEFHGLVAKMVQDAKAGNDAAFVAKYTEILEKYLAETPTSLSVPTGCGPAYAALKP